MAIYRQLQRETVFGPEAIEAMTMAYEGCCRSLKLHDRTDPMTEIIAKKILEIAQTGVRDPVVIQERVLKSLQ